MTSKSGAMWVRDAVFLILFSLSTLGETPILSIHRSASEEWPRFAGYFVTNSVLRLKASTNFIDWQTVGTFHDGVRNWPDVNTNLPYRFFVPVTAGRQDSDDWKNELLFPEERFLSAAGQELQWVKFAILLDDPTRVYFQDSAKYPFHYDFARARLPGFVGMDRAAFDSVSLHKTNQQVVLGTILFSPSFNFVEYGVQFVGLDAYSPEEIASWFKLVKGSIYATNGAGALYMPVFEQSETARTNAAAFEAKGVPISSIERWISINHIYSGGWGLGRLKFFPASQIAAAFADGRLRPEDILLTDGVPAETPLVAGIISLTPSTPNSHTAILSQSFGIPFVYLPDPAGQARVQALVGHKIILRARASFSGSQVKVIDVEGQLEPALEAELIDSKKASPINFVPRQTFGAISASTEVLVPADIKYFGGKAANYGLLRDSVPTNSPPAIAFSFDLWEAFMDQVLPGGQTLRDAIAAQLAGYTNYPPDIPALKTTLESIRDLIRQTATFTAAQKAEILNALAVFDSSRKIRFRSSTNVEDSENFTGAGLYDSYSGCLLDDLDGDTSGPSQCDPSEPSERGVFRAIQRVYASFYNDNAFLERLRHGVDESKVAMGVLVHHSFPDEEELANGVATLRFSYSQFSTNITGKLVTQLGAESVTNPDGASTPEEVEVMRFSGSTFLTLTRRSSLVPLGAYVVEWEKDYRGFVDLLAAVGNAYHKTFPQKSDFTLDFEYKKDLNLGLVVKQVRPIPPAPSRAQTPFLINEPIDYRVLQGESSDLFAAHRLKSKWNLATRNMKLAATNLAQGIYTLGSVEYLENGARRTLSGELSAWPGASLSPNGITNFWRTSNGSLGWVLETTLRSLNSGEPPIFTQDDFGLRVIVTYPQPMPRVDYDGTLMTVTNESVLLSPRQAIGPGMILRNQTVTNKSGVQVEIAYYWPNPERGAVAGYTAPLVEFVETRITGLTAEPIVLHDYYSQTYHPFHHNFVEEYLFEPALEPGIPQATLAELEAAGIQFIYVRAGFEEGVVKGLSSAGDWREASKSRR